MANGHSIEQGNRPADDTDHGSRRRTEGLLARYKSYFGETRKGYSHGLKEMSEAVQDMTITLICRMQVRQCGLSKGLGRSQSRSLRPRQSYQGCYAETKKEMMVEMAAISKELGLANGRFDAAKAFSKTMEVKLETASRRVNELEQLPARVAALTAEIEMLKKTRDAQAQIIEEREEALEVAAQVQEEKGNQAVELQKTKMDMEEAIQSSSKEHKVRTRLHLHQSEEGRGRECYC